MRCKCCDNVLSEWESKARDSIDKSKFLDLCNTCRYHSNPYTWLGDDDTVINKEDINIDNP
jgi:hypothetical protein